MAHNKEKHSSYPDRISVPAGTTWANIYKTNYHPPYFVSPDLTGKDWADPEDISQVNNSPFFSCEGRISLDFQDRPLNPRGPTGLAGRGLLGHWGANFAADPIVTRLNPDGLLELITIKRKDCGLWALPGGMVDKGERVTATLSRELGEESSANLSFDSATPVYQGYVNDPRNTDHAWMETDAYHLHLDINQANQITLQAQDDAVDAQWLVCNQDNLQSLYANHSDLVNRAISIFEQQSNCTVLETGQVVAKEKDKYFPQALVIGRFQPLCNHHVGMLHQVVRDSGARKLLIGLGVSSEINDKNFLDFNERKDMLVPVLDQLGIDYEIKAIVDINNPPEYCAHVESFFPDMNESNTQIFTENDYTRDCFIQHGHNYRVVTPGPQSGKATQVRQFMCQSKNWQDCVPQHVADLIKQNNYIDRLKKLTQHQ